MLHLYRINYRNENMVFWKFSFEIIDNIIERNYWNEVKKILTDEQLEKLEEGNFGMGLNNNFNNSGDYGPGNL